MSKSNKPEFELTLVDDDIREHFEQNVDALYVPKLPIMMQLSRQLRRLSEQLDRQELAYERVKTKKDV